MKYDRFIYVFSLGLLLLGACSLSSPRTGNPGSRQGEEGNLRYEFVETAMISRQAWNAQTAGDLPQLRIVVSPKEGEALLDEIFEEVRIKLSYNYFDQTMQEMHRVHSVFYVDLRGNLEELLIEEQDRPGGHYYLDKENSHALYTSEDRPSLELSLVFDPQRMLEFHPIEYTTYELTEFSFVGVQKDKTLEEKVIFTVYEIDKPLASCWEDFPGIPFTYSEAYQYFQFDELGLPVCAWSPTPSRV